MKRVIAILLVMILVLAGCKDQASVSDTVYDDTNNQVGETTVDDTTVEDSNSEEAAEADSSQVSEEKTVQMPSLPDMDFEGLTFKDDGYEIVEYKSLSDGDTANFVVGGMNMSVRFLAIDTPETSGSSGLQPWGLPAKAYTKNALENAEVIIIEKDLESDIVDKYGRLLGWIWVDGQLLNYQLVEEGLAWVKYLYGDYKYTNEMIQLEAQVQKTKVKIWGEDDPDYDYDNTVKEVTIEEAKSLQTGSTVTITGIVTNSIGQNAFITDGTASVYIYANKYNYGALGKVGAEITLTGKIVEYNGLTEVSSIVDNKITTLSEDNEVVARDIVIDDISEDLEGDYVRLTDLTIERVDGSDEGGYDIVVHNGDDYTTIRIDKYLEDYPDPETLEQGMVITVVGSVGQFLDNYQILISDSTAIIFQ